MPDRFDHVREALLQAGLSPRHVARYLRELTEHHDDIADHLVHKGMSSSRARLEAERRLGSTEALLLPMLADPRFRSFAARRPALVYLVLPLALQAGLVTLAIFALIYAAGTAMRPALPELGSFMAVLLLAAPVIMSWCMFTAAYRRRSPRLWPCLGALILAAVAAALQLGVTLPPAPGASGEIGLTIGLPALVPLVTLALLSLLPLPLQPRLD